MKKFLKMTLSFMLVMVMLFTVTTPILQAKAVAYEKDIPIVYVSGRNRPLFNRQGKQIYPFEESVFDQVFDKAGFLLEGALKSITTGNWDYYSNNLIEIVDGIFSEIRLDNKGNVTNGTYPQKNAEPVKKTSAFNLSDYFYVYDTRIDPFETAADLNDYINKVLENTGADKVHLIGLCLGSAIVATYLTVYGADKIDTLLFYVPSCNGTVECGAPFSGKVKFDAAAINNYVKTEKAKESEDDVLNVLVALLYNSNILGIGTKYIQQIYNKISDDLMPKLLLSCYATMPAYWTLVGDEYYEDAKQFIFNGDYETYGTLIEKIDNYHYNVQVPLYDNLKKFEDEGLKIQVIAEYNTYLPPLFEGSEIQADGVIEVQSQSFGCVAADMGKALSKSYLDSVNKAGKLNYVSNDLVIDASTCLFPDNTWFVKDIYHGIVSNGINQMIYEMLRTNKYYNIHSNSKYPQFMKHIASTDQILPVEISDASGSGGSYTPDTDKGNADKNTPINLGGATVTGIKDKTYTGKDITQSITVKCQGKTLKSGTDYTVTYKNNKNIGKATVTIKGKGNYTGTRTLTFTIIPKVPTGVSATQSTTEITLSWNKVTGASGYRVYKYNSKTKKYEKVKTISSGSTVKYTFKDLKAGTTYKFKVKAYKNVGSELIWGNATEAFSAATKPKKVTISKASAATEQITLNWKKVTGASGYRIYKYNSKKKKYETVKTVTSGSTVKYTIKNLKPGTTYKFKVKAYSKVNGKTIWGSASNEFSATTKPKKVTLSKASAGSKKATLTWKTAAGASGYQIVYSASKDFKKTTKVTVSGKSSTNKTIKSLKKGKKYYFKVRAYKSVNGKKIYGSYSAVKSVKVK